MLFRRTAFAADHKLTCRRSGHVPLAEEPRGSAADGVAASHARSAAACSLHQHLPRAPALGTEMLQRRNKRGGANSREEMGLRHREDKNSLANTSPRTAIFMC